MTQTHRIPDDVTVDGARYIVQAAFGTLRAVASGCNSNPADLARFPAPGDDAVTAPALDFRKHTGGAWVTTLRLPVSDDAHPIGVDGARPCTVTVTVWSRNNPDGSTSWDQTVSWSPAMWVDPAGVARFVAALRLAELAVEGVSMVMRRPPFAEMCQPDPSTDIGA